MDLNEVFEPDVEAELVERLSERLAPDCVLVLPVRVDGGLGIYQDDDLMLVKEMRNAGIDADFLHDPAERTGLSEYAAQDVLLYIIAVSQNMTWDAVKMLVSFLQAKLKTDSQQDSRIELNIARLSRDGVTIDGFQLSATGSELSPERLMSIILGDE